MKVSLKPGTKSVGLIMKKEIHTVHITVQMTEEEKAAAKAAGLLDHQLFGIPVSYKSDPEMMPNYYVKDVANGLDRTGEFSDFLEANEFTNEVKNMLVKLKSALEAKMGQADEEFEL
jgi:hypothetical protein